MQNALAGNKFHQQNACEAQHRETSIPNFSLRGKPKDQCIPIFSGFLSFFHVFFSRLSGVLMPIAFVSALRRPQKQLTQIY
jgi:hypothetical protein